MPDFCKMSAMTSDSMRKKKKKKEKLLSTLGPIPCQIDVVRVNLFLFKTGNSVAGKLAVLIYGRIYIVCYGMFMAEDKPSHIIPKIGSHEAGWVMFTSKYADARGKGLVLPWLVAWENNNKVPVKTVTSDDEPESNTLLPHDNDGKLPELKGNKSDEGIMDKNGNGKAEINKDTNSKNNGDLKSATKKKPSKELGKENNFMESGNNYNKCDFKPPAAESLSPDKQI
eukprot:jgi/Psemu1/22558/gm1.22558_g